MTAPGSTVTLSVADAEALCVEALRAAGASAPAAASLARATVAAETGGQASVGLAHLLDYLDALEAGRIDGDAVPVLTRPTPCIILSDAGGGIAHLGFDRAMKDLATAAGTYGVAIFSQRNAYTCGALGYFAGRLAEAGLVALAATNGPALLAGAGTTRPVFCTNPLAFAAPRAGGPPLLIDQSSSATAFVNVRAAAQRGESIPEGWALGADQLPTTDPNEAMRGALLAFGGTRGANVALMVEVMSAGLSGANWSLDAPPIGEGRVSPGSGLFVLAIAPGLFGAGFEERLGAQLDRLAGHYGLHVPGRSKEAARRTAFDSGLRIPGHLHADLLERARRVR